MSLAARQDALDTKAAARGGLREVAGLAWPVIISQMSSTLMGVVDRAVKKSTAGALLNKKRDEKKG